MNIIVDVALLIEFGWDGITAFLDLVDTFKAISNASTVDAMQRASARIAGSVVGLGAKIVMWAITAGVRWTGKQLKKYQDGKKFLDENGDTPETRDLLAKAKGDAKEAKKLLDAKRKREKDARDKAAAEKAAAEKRAEEKRQREREEAERQRREKEKEEEEQRERERQQAAQQQERERIQQERADRKAREKAAEEERLRKRREEHPDWPVVGQKPVKPQVATPTKYHWKYSEGNFIYAQFGNGVLSVTLKARGEPKARGTDLMNAAIKHFGADRIKRFDGLWVRGTDFEDNLNDYLKHLGGNHASAAAREAAARATWTGRYMDRAGFKNVTVPAHGPNPTEVRPVFSK